MSVCQRCAKPSTALFPTLAHHSGYGAAYFSRVKLLLILLPAHQVSIFLSTLEGLESRSAVPFGSVINLEVTKKEIESSLANSMRQEHIFASVE